MCFVPQTLKLRVCSAGLYFTAQSGVALSQCFDKATSARALRYRSASHAFDNNHAKVPVVFAIVVILRTRTANQS